MEAVLVPLAESGAGVVAAAGVDDTAAGGGGVFAAHAESSSETVTTIAARGALKSEMVKEPPKTKTETR